MFQDSRVRVAAPPSWQGPLKKAFPTARPEVEDTRSLAVPLVAFTGSERVEPLELSMEVEERADTPKDFLTLLTKVVSANTNIGEIPFRTTSLTEICAPLQRGTRRTQVSHSDKYIS